MERDTQDIATLVNETLAQWWAQERTKYADKIAQVKGECS